MSTRTGAETDKRVAGGSAGADAAITIVRVIVGALFVGHGTGKLFGWFGQGGLKGTGAFFKSVGYEPAHTLVIFDGIVEIAAGVLLVLGFLVPLAAAAIIGDMLNAAWVKSSDGFWIADNGFEYEFVLIITMIALTVAGTGAFAIDRNRDWFGNRTGGVAVAIILGLIGGGILAIIRK
jgi:putative oxidoreductase